MKYFLSLLFFAVAISVSAQTKKQTIPPGMAKLGENLFMDIEELRNVDYREYLTWLRQVFGERSEKYLKALPDKKVSPDYYFMNPEANNYPVVGITYEQAISYCKWRSDRIFERDLALKGLIEIDPDQNRDSYFSIENVKSGRYRIPRIRELKGMQIIAFRLPTRDEWELAAAGKLDVSAFPFGIQDSVRIKLKYTINRSVEDNIIKTASFKRGIPNAYGLVNIIGNVAEMTSEKGIAKGGSWKHSVEECKVKTNLTYDKPENWLGFRCVAEIKPYE
jgi:formylglycine-generating enzyme required for sulfatase activity